MNSYVPEYGAHCNGVAGHAGARSHPEEPILRVDRAKLPVGVGSEPGDVVANDGDLDLGIVGFVWLFLALFGYNGGYFWLFFVMMFPKTVTS